MNIVGQDLDFKYLDVLNQQQLLAVKTTEGPLLVLSGAGTGKTKVLTARIAYIIQMALAAPWQILAVTFTNKAANEMKSRIKNMIGDKSENLWIGTFHSIGLKILRQNPEIVGLEKNFLIYDESDQKTIVKQVMEEELNIDTKKWNPAIVLENICRLKDKGYSVDDEIPYFETESVNGYLLDIYKLYQKKLLELNAVDFSDLLLYPYIIFQKEPDTLLKFQNKFRYILVDEYQDTNLLQYKLLKMLSVTHNNICCVGDDDQSIYSWRGAEIDNILKFEQDFKDARIIRLETNYRSTAHILNAATNLISHNKNRLGKQLVPCKNTIENEDNYKIQVHGVYNGEEEALQIVDKISYYQRKKYNLSEMAILVRAGYQTRLFEEQLIRAGISYKIIGGLKFYDRQEIKDIIAYLRLLVYPKDDLSFERIVNVPKRGVGERTLQQIKQYANENSICMFDSLCDLLKINKITGKAGSNLQKFVDDFYRWRLVYQGKNIDLLSEKVTDQAKLVERIIYESGYINMWHNSKKVEAEGKIQNIMEFIGIIKSDFESIPEFLEYITLFTEKNNSDDINQEYVSLMTLHSAKGLEFDIVFLPGWEMGIFPNEKSLAEDMSSSIEEERRLAYVGITRAKKIVEIFFASSRRTFGQYQQNLPSVFLNELSKDDIEFQSYANIYNF